jgi:hypothetical protein
MSERRIVCAAIRRNDGQIIVGPRHYDQTMRNHIRDIDKADWADAEQGFIDQYGKFWTRQEAYLIAESADQFKGPYDNRCGILYSEHLY